MSEEENIDSLLGSVKSRILSELTYSDLGFQDLSHMLNINKNAVKEHMDSLEMRGYVKSYFKGTGNGRPRKYYQLSEKGMSLFPKKYSLLTSLLIEEIGNTYGQEGLNKILGNVAQKIVMTAGINESLSSGKGRDEILRELRQFVGSLNKLGYYARLEITDHSVRIVRHNCIFYELAKVNGKIICGELERNIISKGTSREFNMTEQFSKGGKSCVVEIDVPEK